MAMGALHGMDEKEYKLKLLHADAEYADGGKIAASKADLAIGKAQAQRDAEMKEAIGKAQNGNMGKATYEAIYDKFEKAFEAENATREQDIAKAHEKHTKALANLEKERAGTAKP